MLMLGTWKAIITIARRLQTFLKTCSVRVIGTLWPEAIKDQELGRLRTGSSGSVDKKAKVAVGRSYYNGGDNPIACYAMESTILGS